MSRRTVYVGAIVLAAASASVLAGAASASFPGPNGRLVVLRQGQLYGVELARGREVRLQATLARVDAASVSSDGSSLAVTGLAFGRHSVLVNALGFTGLTGFAEAAPPVYRPFGRAAWAPGGAFFLNKSRFAFTGRRRGKLLIFVRAGLERVPAVALTAGARGDSTSPRWSPDGRWIAFETNRDGNWEVYTMTPRGRRLRNLSRDPASDRLGDWSPDGRSLVFSSNRRGSFALYRMDAAGGGLRRLTFGKSDDLSPVWSPDRRWIAFSRRTRAGLAVYLIRPDGSGLHRVSVAGGGLVQDWQTTRDRTAPVVRLIATRVVAGKTLPASYRIIEASGWAQAIVEVAVRGGGGGYGAEAPDILRTQPVQTHGLDFPGPPVGIGKVAVCVTATDPSGNVSRRTCERLSVHSA